MIMPPLLTLFGKHNNNRTGKTFWHLLSFTINMVMSHKVKVISYELSFRKTYVSKTGNIFYQFVLSDSTKVLGTPMSSSEAWIQKTLNKLLVLNVDGCKHNKKPSQRKNLSFSTSMSLTRTKSSVLSILSSDSVTIHSKKDGNPLCS